MANLSQLRRQRMLAFLEKMREQHKDDDEVLVAINEVENEINEKKYGLVWEEHSEEVEERMVDEVPIFVEDKDKEITMTDNDYNFLLEGDNLHSLHLLEKTHKEKIDVIYIDPPYNTGNDDFIYDDSRVGKDDCFRHSKWLSFMAHRLAIAKNLLSTDGAIFISIDDNEEAQLKSLCDAVFGEQNFVACIPRMTSAQRPAQEAYVSIQHDYLLVYVKQKIGNFRKIIGRQGLEKVKKDNIGTYIPGDTSPILASATQGYSAGGDYDFEYKGVVYSPVANDGSRRRWLWTKDRMEKAAELGILVPTRSGGLRVQNYIDMEFEVGTNLMKPKESNLILASYDFMNSQYVNKNGAQALVDVGVSFSFPKPVQLVKDIISLCDKSDAVVLDFFAGSGTTGQAVLELNRADGGNRHFILCTDNQNNICGGVTYGVQFIIIIDEEHSNKTAKAQEIIDAFDARHIIRVSATTKETDRSEFIEINENDVIASGLITRAIYINEEIEDDPDEDEGADILIAQADKMRQKIFEEYKKQGKVIRPLVLIQFPSGKPETIDEVERILESMGYTYENHMVAKWMSEDKRELTDDIVENDGQPVFLLMKQAISTGWDCPRAKILVKLREGMSEQFTIQTIGRIRRMPERKHYDNDTLDCCYVYTFDQDYKQGLLSDIEKSYEKRHLHLKEKAKTFTLVRETRDLDYVGLGEREVLERIYNYFVATYSLTDDKELNKQKLADGNVYVFGDHIYGKWLKGRFTTLGSITSANMEERSMKVDTGRHGIMMLHSTNELKSILSLQQHNVRAILERLFFKGVRKTAPCGYLRRKAAKAQMVLRKILTIRRKINSTR